MTLLCTVKETMGERKILTSHTSDGLIPRIYKDLQKVSTRETANHWASDLSEVSNKETQITNNIFKSSVPIAIGEMQIKITL